MKQYFSSLRSKYLMQNSGTISFQSHTQFCINAQQAV